MVDRLVQDAPCKLNLFLEIHGKRQDGFHELVTVMESLDLGDTVVASRGAELSVVADRADVPSGEDNLAFRAVRAAEAKLGRALPLRIALEKRLPPGSGLGAGSSDAAAALRAALGFHGVALDAFEQRRLLATIGSDVPFFATGGVALCTGRGEIVAPVSAPGVRHYVVVLGGPPTPTKEVYAAVGPVDVPRDAAALLAALRAGRPLDDALVFNRLEGAALARFPELAAIRERLAAASGRVPHLSGSGSAFFFLAADAADAGALAERVAGATGLEARPARSRPAWRADGRPGPGAELLQHPIIVFGPGRAGTSLARAILDASGSILAIAGGTPARSTEVADALRVPWTAELPDPRNRIVILAVPDDALAGVVARLARARSFEGSFVLHLSGVHGRDVLEPLERRGATTAAFHPLRSFPERVPAVSGLSGALVAIEADDADADLLADFARALGGDPVRLPPAGRALYHLGASLAGNALVGVLDLAVRAAAEGGLDRDTARRGLVHLAVQALENAAARGTEAALTGPVARGDIATLGAHLAALERAFPEQRPLYLELVRATLDVAARGATPAAVERVRAWLEGQRR